MTIKRYEQWLEIMIEDARDLQIKRVYERSLKKFKELTAIYKREEFKWQRTKKPRD